MPPRLCRHQDRIAERLPEPRQGAAHRGGASRIGGTFSAEYGIGRSKLDLLDRYGDPGKMKVMRAIKTALDPHGIMNPGKVVANRPRFLDNTFKEGCAK
ncbi:hypothetical protein B5V01_01135 [Mesorhizobium erdmanii]|uniref:FAD-binding oxidoreductase/transferase type 4 C-terminal domain-containing protein n=2 Tax=Mesorhizobium TaxID=68287 RepID=A0A3M9XAA5_9HYPH|nr:hypothetical protein DNR46_13500 [Mesorhizobium japonicum]RXT51729.1 hypothetical protein B5V01_01135 [Mesorhizobium erdmanii]